MKLIGAVFILLSAAVLSISLSVSARRRLKAAEALLNMSLFIKNRVECFLQPVDKIVESYENDFLEECGFLPLLKKEGLKKALRVLPGEKEYGKALNRFYEESGNGYKTEQITLCQELVNFYSDKVTEMQQALPKKLKLYTGLPPLAAVSVIMMFL